MTGLYLVTLDQVARRQIKKNCDLGQMASHQQSVYAIVLSV
jgi:hypothetical protein